MTDSERDQIDQDAQIFMRTCSEAIKQLRNEGVCVQFSLTSSCYTTCLVILGTSVLAF